MSERYDVSMGDGGRFRMKFYLRGKGQRDSGKGITIWVPYREREFYLWAFREVLGISQLPTLEKGAGGYEWKVLFERRGVTGLRWVRLFREKGLFVNHLSNERRENVDK